MKPLNRTLIWLAGAVLCLPALAEKMTLEASDDSWANGNNVSANYGTSDIMRLRHQNTLKGSNYSLTKFDLSALPDGITIDSVRLRFFAELNTWPGATNFSPVALFNNTQDWAEGSVTFADAPSRAVTPAETLSHFGLTSDPTFFTETNTISSGGWLEYQGPGTVELVQSWADGTVPNYGITIQPNGNFVSDTRMFFLSSKENATVLNRPELIVDYTIGYAAWSNNWGNLDIGSDSNDYDLDGMNNLYEYGLGGDPTNASVQGVASTFKIENVGGSNLAYYIYPQRSDAYSGLAYFLEVSTNLTHGNWTNTGYTLLATNVTGGTLDFVTNRISVSEPAKYVRLRIVDQITIPTLFNVKEYGAQGDGIADDTAAILSAISAANEETILPRVVFPAGTYRIGSTNEYALMLNNLSDVTLAGDGTNTILMVSNPENGGLGIYDSTDITVQDITVDYEQLPFTQGTITAVDTNSGTFDLLIDAGYPELSEPYFGTADARWGLEIDLDREAYGVWAYFSSSWVDLGSRTWRMTADSLAYLQSHPLTVGDRYAHMARRWNAFGVGFYSCTGVRLENVNIHASAGLATGIINSGGIVVKGHHVGIKPGSTRLLGANGDGIHSSGCVDGLLIEDCSLSGMPDDGINIHGRGGVIIQNISDTVKRVGIPRKPTIFAAGNEIQIFKPTGIYTNAIILSATQINDDVWELTLDRALPNLIADWATGDKLSNLSRCGQGSLVNNNLFGMHRGRDIVLRSHDITITNNHFFNPSKAGTSVSLAHESWYYAEGPASYNIDILNNRFEGGTNQWDWASPAIKISSDIGSTGNESTSHDSFNVRIESNTFVNIPGAVANLSSVRDVQITGNTVNTALGLKLDEDPTILLGHARDIQITDLDIQDENPATYAAIHILSTVSSATDAVTITNLTTTLANGSVNILDER